MVLRTSNQLLITHVTFTDIKGNVLVWEKAGTSGFKGSRKSTAYAATKAGKMLLKRL